MTATDLTALIKKHPLGFGCGCIGVICSVLLYLRSGNIDKSQTDLEAAVAQVAIMNANVRNASGLPEQLAEAQALSKEIDARIMKANQLAVNLQYFYKLETENEVKLIDVRQNSFPRSIKTQYAGVPFNISIQGQYMNVMNFLNRLQHGRHFCRVITTNFAKAGGTGDELNLSINLELLGQP
jgi:hypothetical protein